MCEKWVIKAHAIGSTLIDSPDHISPIRSTIFQTDEEDPLSSSFLLLLSEALHYHEPSRAFSRLTVIK